MNEEKKSPASLQLLIFYPLKKYTTSSFYYD